MLIPTIILYQGAKKAQLCWSVPEDGQGAATSTDTLSFTSTLSIQPTSTGAQGQQGWGASVHLQAHYR